MLLDFAGDNTDTAKFTFGKVAHHYFVEVFHYVSGLLGTISYQAFTGKRSQSSDVSPQLTNSNPAALRSRR